MKAINVPNNQVEGVAGKGSMRRHGKSFWFASLFLPRATANDAAELYAFCRIMDDLADESEGVEAVPRLEQVRFDFRRGTSNDPCVQPLLALAQRHPLDLQVADHLVKSFVEDAATRLQLETEPELIRYCYGVAGTVGLMMSSILGADPMQAPWYATDLGIAMQMTNIARDVLEDARDGRRYLPGSWVQDLAPGAIASCDPILRPCVSAAILRLLHLADHFYASAASGFRFIPSRSRPAIEVAAVIYRAIGVSLRGRGAPWWEGRVVVPPSRKTGLAASVLLGVSPLRRLAPTPSTNEIHQPLAGLPGLA